MKVAICGYPPLAAQIIAPLKNLGVECNYFVRDFISSHGEENFNLPTTIKLVNFFEFRRLIDSGALDGLIIYEGIATPFTFGVLKTCKLYNIQTVGVVNSFFFGQANGIYWLDTEKAFLPYMEANLIDSCNLNCKGCTHYSNLFSDDDFYSLENFARDIRRVADTVDVVTFRLLGGEPLKLKNLDQYIKVARKFLPKTDLRLVTNGLLIPSAPQSLFDALRDNKIILDISFYPPTMKIFNEIKTLVEKNNVMCPGVSSKINPVEYFNVFLSLQGGHNPLRSRAVCNNDFCRLIRDGKIYKCPLDALGYRFAERFGLKDFPASVGVDIFAKNFPTLLEQLRDTIELCTWCNETRRFIPWQPTNKPVVEDWLANPAEAEKLLS